MLCKATRGEKTVADRAGVEPQERRPLLFPSAARSPDGVTNPKHREGRISLAAALTSEPINLSASHAQADVESAERGSLPQSLLLRLNRRKLGGLTKNPCRLASSSHGIGHEGRLGKPRSASHIATRQIDFTLEPWESQMPTNNPVVLITGGGTGVGRAAAVQLAEKGFDVVINYSRSASDAEETRTTVEQLGRRAITLQCNVSKDTEVRAMLEKCEQEFGRLDGLVNNAGTTHFVDLVDLEGMTESMWDDILGVNLKGAFFVSRAAVPLMQQTGGSIVNVASIAGITGAGSSLAYAASKGGMITLSKSLAQALAPSIRVNSVCPGVIISRWLADHQPMIDRAVAATPMERASSTDDVADAITFLISGGEMITGQSIVVDGGYTL